MAVIGFNTSRLYGADGQRISVGLSEDGSQILMNDHSRGIWYELNVVDDFDREWLIRMLTDGLKDKLDAYDFAHRVMNAYDHNNGHRISLEAGRLNAGMWWVFRI